METVTPQAPVLGANFQAFADLLNTNFHDALGKSPFVFTVDTEALSTLYVQSFPGEALSQHHNCSVCRQFIRNYGGAVSIDERGNLTSLMWNPSNVPEEYTNSVMALKLAVERRPVKGLLIDNEPIWGRPIVNGWNHFALQGVSTRPQGQTHRSDVGLKAYYRERIKILNRNIDLFSPHTVQEAINLLSSDALPGAERYLAWAKWFLAQVNLRRSTTHSAMQRRHLQWLGVTQAANGWVELKSSVLGTVLEDLDKGASFAEIKGRWAEMTRADQFQRPQVAPTAGNLQTAERIVATLGVASAFQRRYATRDEVRPFAIWQPTETHTEAPESNGSVFGHLTPKGAEAEAKTSLRTPPVAITWEKFERKVLPEALKIRAALPHDLALMGGILTAVDPESKPILKWDNETQRNQFSWYINMSQRSFGRPVMGTQVRHYSLAPGLVEVEFITPMPSHFYPDRLTPSFSTVDSMYLALKGSVPPEGTTLCLFPEILRNELHEIRASIEALSSSSRIERIGEEAATGLFVGAGMQVQLEVTTAVGVRSYIIDRMD